MINLVIWSILITFCHSRVFFFEDFNDKRYRLRWFKSIDNIDKQGMFTFGYGPLAYDQSDGQGLKTEDDYRFYLLSSKMKQKYSNRNKTLVIQYQVVFPSLMECGGAYIKILGSDFETTTFSSKSPYKIMFGPDVCGFAFEDRDLKAIINYKGKYYKINQVIRYHISHIPQLFTFIIRPDNTYEIQVNMSQVAKGNIGKDFRMIRPKMIRDKRAKPPPNWEHKEFIIKHNYKIAAHKPHQLRIIDPEYYANTSMFQGSNGLPYIDNPHYMKPWHPGFMRNPLFKGAWVPPLIHNPDFNIMDDFYLQSDLGGVAIDIWQMSSGVIYDNILVTDNEKFARKLAKEKWRDAIELALNSERNAKPYNQTMEQNNGDSFNQNQNENHHEYVDDTGQVACYNNIEALKNTVFGPTTEKLNEVMLQRSTRLIKMKEDLISQLSPLPQYSFYDPRYFLGDREPVDYFDLEKRIKIIEGRRLTETLKFITENSLTSF